MKISQMASDSVRFLLASDRGEPLFQAAMERAVAVEVVLDVMHSAFFLLRQLIQPVTRLLEVIAPVLGARRVELAASFRPASRRGIMLNLQ